MRSVLRVYCWKRRLRIRAKARPTGPAKSGAALSDEKLTGEFWPLFGVIAKFDHYRDGDEVCCRCGDSGIAVLAEDVKRDDLVLFVSETFVKQVNGSVLVLDELRVRAET